METIKKKGSAIQKKIGKFVNRDWDKVDIIIMIVLFVVCAVSFGLGDVRVTGNRSFLMHTNFLDFYDASHAWTGDYGANYLPSTFWLYAIWTLPLRLFGRVPGDIGTNSLLNITWYKLLPLFFFFGSAVLIYKICLFAGFGEKKSRLCKYAFLVCPIAVFSQMIVAQYDSFTIFFILLGFYYFLKKDDVKFLLSFGIAITFKYQALIYFLAFLLLREKGIFKIIKNTILVLIPTIIEVLIYLPSESFRKSVFGFPALSYVNTEVYFGGLKPINLFLAVLLGILVFAYIKKVKEEDLFSWCIFLASGISFAFFGLAYFHPQWLLIIVPFLVMSIMTNRNCKIMLILQNIFIVALYVLTVNIWTSGVDQQMFDSMIFKKYVPSGWAITMKDVYRYNNQVYLFTCIFVLLLLFFILAHPRFRQKDITVLEQDTMVNIRIPFLVGVFAWIIPAFFCLSIAIKGEFLMVNEEIAANHTPVGITKDVVVSQPFENTAEKIYDFEVFIGNYGKINTSDLKVAIVENESGENIYANTISLEKFSSDNSWYSIIDEEIAVIPGQSYRLELSSVSDADNCIAVYVKETGEDENVISINGDKKDEILEMKIKGCK